LAGDEEAPADEAMVEDAGGALGAAGADGAAPAGVSSDGTAALSDLLQVVDSLATLAGGNDGGKPLRAGWEATAGRRGADRMEDRHVLCAREGLTIAAVFDGHNGDACAEYCRTSLPSLLLHHWSQAVKQPSPSSPSPAEAALHASFVAMHEGFLRSVTADDSGCTALGIVCTPGRVWIANAGDCQCHLWRGDELLCLTEEHTAALPSERARVEAAGAEVSATADGKLRVGGIIQVTRCIGDRPLRKLGLTSEPQLHSFTPTADDKALILASDGLWDVMPPARVLHCCNNTAKSPDMFAKRLLTEALDRGTDDNTSIVVVFLQDLT